MVLPVRLEGLRHAFDKTGLKLCRFGVEMSVRYGRPLDIDYSLSAAEILRQVMAGIGETGGADMAAPERQLGFG